MQFIYAITAAVGFAYVSTLAVSLTLGNLVPLTDQPGLTALLCLLSGISLANLCRHRSARFWKIADLVWIVTFVPSLAMTVLLHQQEEVRREFDRLLKTAIEMNRHDAEFLKLFANAHCIRAVYPYDDACSTADSYLIWLEEHGMSGEAYLSLFTKAYRFKKMLNKYYFVSSDSVNPVAEWQKEAKKLLGRIQALHSSIKALNGDNVPPPITLEDYERQLSIFQIQFLQPFFGPFSWKLRKGESLTDLEAKSYRAAIEIDSLLQTLVGAKVRFEQLVELYEAEIMGQIPNTKFFPIIFACFIFPFRIGKSIFEIAAKKEIKDAALSS